MADSKYNIKYSLTDYSFGLRTLTINTANKWLAENITVDFSLINNPITYDLTTNIFGSEMSNINQSGLWTNISIARPTFLDSQDWSSSLTILGVQGKYTKIESAEIQASDTTGQITSALKMYTKDLRITSPNLKASNIISGARILGIDGTAATASSVKLTAYRYDFKPTAQELVNQFYTISPSAGYNGFNEIQMPVIKKENVLVETSEGLKLTTSTVEYPTNGLTEGPGSVCNGNFKITTSISSESIWDGSFNIAQ